MPPSYVLVVDDDDGIRETVVEILADASIDAYGAGTGAAALRIAAGRPPTVAVVDYRLPDMTGIDVVEQLKSGDPALPVIIITGFATLQTAVSAVGVVDEYLTKPVRPERIVASVRAMLERRRLDAENVELGGRIARAQARAQEVLRESERELDVLVDLVRTAWAWGPVDGTDPDHGLARMLAAARERMAAAAVAAYAVEGHSGEDVLRLLAATGDWEAPASVSCPEPGIAHDLLGQPARWATVVPVSDGGQLTGAILVAEARHGSPRLLRALAAALAPTLAPPTGQPSAVQPSAVLLPGPRDGTTRPAEHG